MIKKSPKKTVQKDLPITINLKLAGQDKVIKTDNVLEVFRNLKIEPEKIKSRMTLEVTYNGETLRRIYTIIQVKRMLANDITRQIMAKYIHTALGVK